MIDYNIEIDEVLDYCDEPVIVVIRDQYDTLYLSMMYDDKGHYLTIKTSRKRLEEIKNNHIDLREAYISPENKGEYYILDLGGSTKHLTRAQFDAVPEDMLPERGYRFTEPETETMTVTISRSDRSLFKSIVKRFGWVAM